MKKLFSMQALALAASLFSSVQLDAQNWLLAGNANPAANQFLGTTTNHALRFRTNNTEKMTLTGAGLLGLNTIAPSAKLHVVGDANANAMIVAVGATQKFRVNSNGSVGIGGTGLIGTTDGLAVQGRTSIGTSTASAMLHVRGAAATEVFRLTTEGTTRWRMDANGNTFVGTAATAPAALFHIDGTAQDEPLLVQIAGATKLKVNDNGSVSIGGISVPTPNGLFVAGKSGLGTGNPLAKLHVVADANDEALLVRTSDDLTRLKVTSNGGVSIGTTQTATPNGLIVGDKVLINCINNAATADYMLAVNGKAICEEMRVKLSGNWPDYVFAADYRLPKLAEIEAFISENGHLPGIPSASVVEKNGHDVGEMNRLLLEKVEQLTLHLIALEKEIASLKSR